MSWSLGETQALAVKAARGAGMPWGVAEEAGFAVRWLQACGAPGVQALAALLHDHDSMQLAGEPSSATACCPLHIGMMIVDSRMQSLDEPFILRQPLLIVPFLSLLVSGSNRWVQLSCSLHEPTGTRGYIVDQSSLLETLDKDEQTLPLLAQADCVYHCSASSANPLNATAAAATKTERVNAFSRVPATQQPYIQELEHFAHRTYAPATDESRLKGAGAGLNDND